MAKHSAALLPYRVADDGVLEVFIAHMGGPFWAKKDDGAWSVVKGEYDPEQESSKEVAAREFNEEIGRPAPSGQWESLGDFKQPSGKIISAYAVETSEHIQFIESNTFELEWPKGSGKVSDFPEVDRAAWFELARARVKVLKGHVSILDCLFEKAAQEEGALLEARDGTLF